MSTKDLLKNRASMAVTQDHLENQPKWIVVNTDREFLLFLEAKPDRIPILLELTEDRQVKMTVRYDKNRTFPLLELETPATLLGVFDLKDDSDERFAKLCKVTLALWRVGEWPPTYDLLISSAKTGLHSADDKILWWKVAGFNKEEPSKPCTITHPVIQRHLLAYELVDTEAKQFEVIRKYRKLDETLKPLSAMRELEIARIGGATHKDRDGNFYKKGVSGIMIDEVKDGLIIWKLSQYYHMPEITEVL